MGNKKSLSTPITRADFNGWQEKYEEAVKEEVKELSGLSSPPPPPVPVAPPQTVELPTLVGDKNTANKNSIYRYKNKVPDFFPAVYKAGFFVGAEGGNGLVIARDTHGNWGYPAFYTLAGGSWGIQFGGQRAGVVLIMRSRKAVEAVLKHQGKAGADLGIALGSIGTGLEGSTTTNLAADIFAFSDAKGLFGGFSLEGTAIVRRNDLNREYYGANVTPAAILIDHARQNAQADTLRDALIVR